MFCLYWHEGIDALSHWDEDLSVIMKMSEQKRAEGFRFVSICSELTDNVTKMGVAAPSPDYHWPKRRT